MGGTITSISRPGRWTSTLLSLPISLVTLSRMRAAFYPRRENIRREGRWCRSKIGELPMIRRSAAFLAALLPLIATAAPPSQLRPQGAGSARARRRAGDDPLRDRRQQQGRYVHRRLHRPRESRGDAEGRERGRAWAARGQRGDDDFTLRRIRREHPADVYLGINAFSCTMTDHSGEGSEHDTTASGEAASRLDGCRVQRAHRRARLECEADPVVHRSRRRDIAARR
jgi:hypothetical protein